MLQTFLRGLYLSSFLCAYIAAGRGKKKPHGIKTGLQGPSRPPNGTEFHEIDFNKRCERGDATRKYGPGVENICGEDGVWVQCAVGRNVPYFTPIEVEQLMLYVSDTSSALKACEADPDFKLYHKEWLYVTLKAINREKAGRMCYKLKEDFSRLRDVCGLRPGRTRATKVENLLIYFDTKYITDPPKDSRYGEWDYPWGKQGSVLE
jgi:hypothetical protein